MKKQFKSILAISIAALIITTMFSACSKKEAVAETTSVPSTTVTTTQITTEAMTEEQTEAEEPQDEKNDSDSNNSNGNSGSSSSGKSSGGSSSSKSSGSSGNNSSGNSGNSSSNSGGNNYDRKPETTTQERTTKKETTVKNVSAKDVQREVNAYIKSKGITLDSSMTPDNASWSGQISDRQDGLNNGHTLKTCKDEVDLIIKDYNRCNGCNPMSIYCYYDGNDFYILSW